MALSKFVAFKISVLFLNLFEGLMAAKSTSANDMSCKFVQ